MFSNFLYFLVALIVYTTADFFQEGPRFETTELLSVLGSAISVYILFFVVCQLAFRWLEIKARSHSLENIDYLVNKYISRLSVFALFVFSVMVYHLKLTKAFSDIAFFEVLPTGRAVIFIGIFLFSLVMIWDAAFRVQKTLFAGTISKKEYIFSNVSFSLPALMPWFVISIIADILGTVPWMPLKNFMDTPAGEIGYVAVFIVTITIFGPVFIKRIWNCRSLEPGSARNRIETVCAKAGLKYADILRWELFGGNMITAGVMGLVGHFRYILVTPALLNSLEDNELDAVMLHEIGHVQKQHMLFYLFFFAGFIACNFVFFEPVIQLLYIAQPIYSLFDFAGIGRETAHPVVITLTMILSFILYFRFVFGIFMRNFERQADLHVYQFVPDAGPLISTFYKIASFSRQSINKPNWHHFSIGQRVRFLEKCQKNPALIQAHHSKVKKMIAGYFLILLMVFASGYSINYGAAKPVFENFIAEKILFLQMDIEPENSDIYALVGDYYYNKNEYQKAIDSYENVLRIAPDNVHALNNLSWLFATCPDEAFRDKQKALENAKKAIEYKREAFVLDTYAEALFANNDIENAVKMAKEALHISKTKREYYQGQLIRFEKRLLTEKT